jgi:hypothetical protein
MSGVYRPATLENPSEPFGKVDSPSVHSESLGLVILLVPPYLGGFLSLATILVMVTLFVLGSTDAKTADFASYFSAS